MASSHSLLQLNHLYRHPTTSFHHKPSFSPSLNLRRKLNWPLSLSLSSSHTYNPVRYEDDEDEEEEDDDERVIGDCLVFEEGVFEDPYLTDEFYEPVKTELKLKESKSVVEVENLVPERWKEVQEAINITKKERRFIAQQAEFGVRLDRKRKGMVPLRNEVLEEEYVALRNEKLAQLNPLVLDNPSFEMEERKEENGVEEEVVEEEGFSGRVKPKNPKWAVYGRSMNDITEFFNSGDYVPGDAVANQGKIFAATVG